MTNELAPLQAAKWIGSSHPFDLHEVYLCLRSPTIQLTQAEVAAAELLITADSRYKLWVNGQFVARGPERCYPEQQAVDRIDLRPYLHAGVNQLAVQLYQPGYSHFSYLHRGAAGLLAALLCDGKERCVTDTRWRVRRDASWSDQTPRISIYGSGVEVRNLNHADLWTSPTYLDSDWDEARIVALPGTAPWTGLRLRTMPLLHEREQPLHLVEMRRGKSAEADDPHMALRTGWTAAQSVPAQIDAEERYSPRLDAQESAYWLFDLGRSYTGQGVVTVTGARGGETLRISYAEKMQAGELVLSDPTTYCRVKMTDQFQLRPGDQVVKSFALRGGRFLLFQLSGPSHARLRFQARISEYPLKVTKPFTSADARHCIEDQSAAEATRLESIATLCENTLAACLQDSFVDCGWRENSQWLGDALPQALILASMNDDVRPLRKVITMAAAGAYPDGILPSILPGEVHAYAVLDYNFTWVELLALYLKLTNDRALVAELWPTLARMLDRFDADLGVDQLIRSQPGRRLFLDWAPLTRTEPHALYNLRYLLALQQAATLARSLPGGESDSLLWSARAQTVQRAAVAAFWRNERWYDDLARTTFSQLSAAFALLTGSTPAHAVRTQLDGLAARSLDPDDAAQPDKMVLASPFMHHYVFEALKQHGRSGDVVAIIRLRWGRWIDVGSPTAWENWNVDFPDGSQSHAFSAHPRYHLAEIARQR